jgi:hypothetical protein
MDSPTRHYSNDILTDKMQYNTLFRAVTAVLASSPALALDLRATGPHHPPPPPHPTLTKPPPHPTLSHSPRPPTSTRPSPSTTPIVDPPPSWHWYKCGEGTDIDYWSCGPGLLCVYIAPGTQQCVAPGEIALAKQYDQCGTYETGWRGRLFCEPPFVCYNSNSEYSQCLYPTVVSSIPPVPTQTQYGQCGPIGMWSGPQKCAQGLECRIQNYDYWQCLV